MGAGGFTPTSRKEDGALQEHESTDRSKVGGGTAAAGAGTKQSNRNDYIHSGLYTSFHLNSLQNGCQLFKSIKIENPPEKRGPTAPTQSQDTPPQLQLPAAPPSVIKFGNSPPKPAPTAAQVVLEPTLMPSTLDPLQGLPVRAEDIGTHSALQPHSVYPFEPTRPSEPVFSLSDLSSASPSPNLLPESSQELSVHIDVEMKCSEPAVSQAQQTTDSQAQDKVSTQTSLNLSGPKQIWTLFPNLFILYSWIN